MPEQVAEFGAHRLVDVEAHDRLQGQSDGEDTGHGVVTGNRVHGGLVDVRSHDDPTAAIGCGPYRFIGFDKDAGILTYQANDNYWGGKPAIDVVELRMFKNPDALMLAFQKGEIDLPYYYSKGISYYYVPKLLENSEIVFIPYFFYISFCSANEGILLTKIMLIRVKEDKCSA